MYLLAADIGGTKTKAAIYPIDGDPHNPIEIHTLQSVNFSSFDQIIQTSLDRYGLNIIALSVGVAGPILDGRVRVTNLPWVIDRLELLDRFKFEGVFLLNDLEAIANAVPILLPEDLEVINPGEADETGAIAVIAPGTGLGEAYLTWDGNRYQAHPSEGGHADFAPTNPIELELLKFMRTRYHHISYERLCSGIGLPNIYDFVSASREDEISPELASAIANSQDRTPLIARAALDPTDPCPVCSAALEIFVSILGSEAGNLALKVLATGGVYLAGGMPPKILPALVDGKFLDAFARKGRFEEHMRNIPVYLIRNQASALLGAANFGLTAMSS